MEVRLLLRPLLAIVLGIVGLLTIFVVVLAATRSSGELRGGARRVVSHAAPAPSRPIDVPLRVRSVLGAQPMIDVRVGTGPKVPVLLDTGSVGLHIYRQAVRLGPGGGVTVSSRRNAIAYVDGTVQSGVVARAKLTIGGVTTARRVDFGLISQLRCDPRAPHCPGARGIDAAVAFGSYGIMGIGLSRPRGGPGNPLLGLRAPYSRTWSIALRGSAGRLTLGARPPANPAARFRLRRDGTQPSGAPAWNDLRTRVCWGTAEMRGEGCEPTAFDTGSVTMLWFGGLLSHATTTPGSILVTPGTYIAAWEPGAQSAFWDFTAGTTLSKDTVIAYPGGRAAVIAAVQAFYKFTITYDAAEGEILLARR